MATWQYSLAVVPKHSLLKLKSISMESDDDYESLLPWRSGSEEQIKKALTSYFGCSTTLGQITSWGRSDETCAKVIEREDRSIEVVFRLDLRSLRKEDIQFVIHFVEAIDGAIFDERRKLLENNMNSLRSNIRQSRAFSFLKDPVSFLTEVSE